MSQLSEKVLQTIKNKSIKPKPKWHFLLNNWVIWCIGILSLLIGSFAVSVMVFILVNNDWDVYPLMNKSLLTFVLFSLPYLWMLFLGGFIFMANYNFKHTKNGYRYPLHRIVIMNVLVSVLLGFGLYYFGYGQRIDTHFAKRSMIYQKMMHPKLQRWQRPDLGFLSGEVIEIKSSLDFYIEDLSGKKWHVISNPFQEEPFDFRESSRLRMMGKAEEENLFKAERIMRFFPKGRLLNLGENKIERNKNYIRIN